MSISELRKPIRIDMAVKNTYKMLPTNERETYRKLVA